MATLLDLPPELICNIAVHLPKDDVHALRLTSRQLERATLSDFGHRFFRKKGYMLTTDSLSVLALVARHNELRKYVQHVWFNPDCFTFQRADCMFDEHPDVSLAHGSSEHVKFTAFMECQKDHDSYFRCSAARLQTVLVGLFRQLPNVEVVGMRRSEDHNPWGWSRLRDAVGEDPRVLGTIPDEMMDELQKPTLLFIAMINSLAESGTKLKRMYTDAIELDNIKPDVLSNDALTKACSSLWYLEANVTKGLLSKWGRGRDAYISSSDLAPTDFGNGLVRLLQACPNLKELGLQVFPDRKQSHMVPPVAHNPETWRRSYQFLCLGTTALNVRLVYLTRVKLEKFTASQSTLLALLSSSSASLRSLKLRDIRLLGETRAFRPWRAVFEFLRDSCPQLDYVLFNHLMYQLGGISFVEHPPMPLPPSETDPTTGAPNPPFSDPPGSDFFGEHHYVALEVKGKGAVHVKLADIVEQHWYQKPIFGHAMDDDLWHTDTSDEEW